jgi:protein PsiE
MIKDAITYAEKAFLVIIAMFTIFAMYQEVVKIITHWNVELKDLLLMFIYAEVLGMLGAFYSSHKIPITIPLFIAMTALSRLIILQGKDSDPALMLYESAAILMISLACVAIGYHQKAAEQMARDPPESAPSDRG